jgi:hypothetical protein
LNTPKSKTTKGKKDHLGLIKTHSSKKKNIKKNKYGKNKLRKPMNHHFCGGMSGA